VGGSVLQRQREFPGFIERALVRRLGLSHSPNADKRIGSLRAQGYSIEAKAKVDPGLSDAKFEVDVHRAACRRRRGSSWRRSRRMTSGRVLTAEDVAESYKAARDADVVFSLKRVTTRRGLFAGLWDFLRGAWAAIIHDGSNGGF
jgi:hypothetical protein